ncbi:dipeptidase [Plebeiibacterium sediminum]|uniref:Dipeptidase n=1 Tax=Plebeiibacterium sediminum TaxID=2992112 RepID=A0AAE3M3H6_9BACT|nr:dipeptidase [Plebeiobacterium sediminum]MCW3786502.1 dipeptidase [Plebeiobacterium sediminum]
MAFLKFSAIIIAFSVLFPKNFSLSDAKRVHNSITTIDTHCDTPMKFVNNGFDISVSHEAPESRVDIPRMEEGGLDAIFFAIFTSQKPRNTETYKETYDLANQMIDSTIVSLEHNKSTTGLATSVKDLQKLEAENKRAIFLGMENGFPIAKDINRVKEFYDKGVRYLTLCHSSNNDICDSSTDPKGAEHHGVSKFGKEVIKEMNKLGMIIDVSHISDTAFYDVMKYSKAPVVASHSSVRSVCDHPRNMSDDMIKLLAKNDGVIQICILGDYIKSPDTTSVHYTKMQELKKKYNNWQYKNDDERKQAWAEWDAINKNYPQVLPTIADAVDHIDYVVKLVGIDHVGIGSDFDGGGGLADCTNVADFPKITLELLRRGYSEDDIAKIWGGNFLRVFKAVEKLKA